MYVRWHKPEKALEYKEKWLNEMFDRVVGLTEDGN